MTQYGSQCASFILDHALSISNPSQTCPWLLGSSLAQWPLLTHTDNYEEISEKVVSRLLVKTSIAQWKLHWRDLGEISAWVKRSIHNMMEDIKYDHMLPLARSTSKS